MIVFLKSLFVAAIGSLVEPEGPRAWAQSASRRGGGTLTEGRKLFERVVIPFETTRHGRRVGSAIRVRPRSGPIISTSDPTRTASITGPWHDRSNRQSLTAVSSRRHDTARVPLLACPAVRFSAFTLWPESRTRPASFRNPIAMRNWLAGNAARVMQLCTADKLAVARRQKQHRRYRCAAGLRVATPGSGAFINRAKRSATCSSESLFSKPSGMAEVLLGSTSSTSLAAI
jgi:hypothetical protein